jgi:hypothetical protein
MMMVVALGSGAHSLAVVNTSGTTLYDLHSEVLARRALLSFLYQVCFCAHHTHSTFNPIHPYLQQIKLFYHANQEMAKLSLYEKDETSGKLKMKVCAELSELCMEMFVFVQAGFTLHMFTSVTPQGDARVRSNDAAERGVLRFYAENGEWNYLYLLDLLQACPSRWPQTHHKRPPTWRRHQCAL